MEDILYYLFSMLSSFLFYIMMYTFCAFLVKELTMGIFTGKTKLDGKLVVITGANCGIGLETARDLASRGAQLIIGCRNIQKGESAVRSIIASTGNSNVEIFELDLLSLESVRRFAQEVSSSPKPLHLLINNAGMFDGNGVNSWAIGKGHLSKDGLEICTQTNHFSHFLLTNLLKQKLVADGGSRVINVSSVVALKGKIDLENLNYEKDSSAKELKNNYGNSKLMNILFTKEISKRWGHFGVTSYSLHPGCVRSEVFRQMKFQFDIFKSLFNFCSFTAGKSCSQGAQTTIFLACQKGIENQSGSFFGDCRNWDFLLPKKALDPNVSSGLWERSAELVQLDM